MIRNAKTDAVQKLTMANLIRTPDRFLSSRNVKKESNAKVTISLLNVSQLFERAQAPYSSSASQ
jgi:hypothetical protein